MALIYKPIQSKKATEDGQYLYHPRAVYTGNVSTDQLAREVAAYSSLTSGDVKNTIDNLVTVMTTHLQASETVTLDGLGTFRLVFNSRGKGAPTAKEVRVAQATLLVRFSPTSTRKSDGTLATRALVTGVKCVLQSNQPASGNEGGSGQQPDGDDSGELG